MALPLKKTISIVVMAAGITLAGLLGLGLRQVQLVRSQAEITAQAEKIIFQFTIIREHLDELLLAGQYDKLPRVATELEELNDNLTRLLSLKEITEEYRMGLLNGMDLPGTILLVRKLGEGPGAIETVRQLNAGMRALNERLLLFDRLLVSATKARLINFQNIVIGMLALLLSLLVGILMWLRRRVVVPLAQLDANTARVLHENTRFGAPPQGCVEVEALGGTLAELLAHRQQLAEEAAGCRQLTATVKRTALAMAGANDRHQLFRDVCRALLHNPEYCLVWIGEPDAAGVNLQPAAADGSTTMSRKECESCLAVLLTEAEEKDEAHNPALLAMRSRRPAVVPDILAGIPRGLLKGTPLAERDATCVALPIEWQGQLYGVISIYALSSEGFAERELAQLEALAATLGFATAALGLREAVTGNRDMLRHLFEALGLVVLGTDSNGRIVSANAVALTMTGSRAEGLRGRRWDEVLRIPPGAAPGPEGGLRLAEMAASRQGLAMLLAGPQEERAVQCYVVPAPPAGDGPTYWCVAAEAGLPGGGEGYGAPRLALLGEIATGMAHEISDLSNGMINYAQVLADEAADSSPQAGILGSIITAGEHVAAMVGKLVFYGEAGQPEEFLPLVAVLRDTMTLGGYHLRKSGIQLTMLVPDDLPALPVNARQLQQVFLELFSHARRALNLRYPGRHENKRFEIDGQVVNSNGRDALRLAFTDHGGGMGAHQFESAGTPGEAHVEEGLARSREIVVRHGGSMGITAVPGESTTITLEFPVTS